MGECFATDGARNPAKGNEVAAIPTNLPQEQNSFVGRERELDELRQLLGVTRALTLCGTGGIGKTRLALQVLAAVADEFPDGAWFVELGDLQQPDLVASRVAAAVGVGEEPGRPLLDTLADALRPRRLLLALDNCEHLIDACARVCQRLLASSPGLRVIATSREPLRVAAETVWQVPPLSVAPDGAAVAPEDALPVRGHPPVRRPGRGVAARLRHRPGQLRGRRGALPRAGRRAAGDRAGGRLGPGAVGGADRRAAGRPVRAAHHR